MNESSARTHGMRLSLRLKLTLWMVLLFLVVQLSLVLIYQFYQRRSIEEFYNGRIKARQEQIGAELKDRLPTISHTDLYELADHYRGLLVQKNATIEIFDVDGEPVASSQRTQARLPAPAWKIAKNATTTTVIPLPTTFLRDERAEAVRGAAGWIAGPDSKLYLLVLGWNDVAAQEIQRLLGGVVFISIPIGLIAMIVSAYAISGVAVQPILAMRQMAKGLEPERLSEQLPRRGAGSELEMLRQDLDSTRLRLEAAFAAQERFMSNVSHELKTPIAVLLTEAQTLKLEGASPSVRAFVGSAADELDKLGRMVDSFLMLTRVRHGKATVPNRELCLARDLMVASYEGCAPMAAQYGVRLTLRLPEGNHVDVGVHGNCDLLRTILDNLIRNAIRFSPKGDIVELDGGVEDERLILRVRDLGPGIPVEVLPRIFDRFAQSREEQRRGRGHGLGLEIALGITELHGGTITAANRPDGGCEFTVSLPLASGTSDSSGPRTAR